VLGRGGGAAQIRSQQDAPERSWKALASAEKNAWVVPRLRDIHGSRQGPVERDDVQARTTSYPAAVSSRPSTRTGAEEQHIAVLRQTQVANEPLGPVLVAAIQVELNQSTVNCRAALASRVAAPHKGLITASVPTSWSSVAAN
jgi:hypothetical protein